MSEKLLDKIAEEKFREPVRLNRVFLSADLARALRKEIDNEHLSWFPVKAFNKEWAESRGLIGTYMGIELIEDPTLSVGQMKYVMMVDPKTIQERTIV